METKTILLDVSKQYWETSPWFAGIICTWYSNANNQQITYSGCRSSAAVTNCRLILASRTKVYPSLGISKCSGPICQSATCILQAELMQTTAWKNLRKSGQKKGFELWSSLIADASWMVCLIWGQPNLVL